MSMRSKYYWKAEQRRQPKSISLLIFLSFFLSLSLCWTTMYHSFRSNGCLAAMSGYCIDGQEDIIVCISVSVYVWSGEAVLTSFNPLLVMITFNLHLSCGSVKHIQCPDCLLGNMDFILPYVSVSQCFDCSRHSDAIHVKYLFTSLQRNSVTMLW